MPSSHRSILNLAYLLPLIAYTTACDKSSDSDSDPGFGTTTWGATTGNDAATAGQTSDGQNEQSGSGDASDSGMGTMGEASGAGEDDSQGETSGNDSSPSDEGDPTAGEEESDPEDSGAEAGGGEEEMGGEEMGGEADGGEADACAGVTDGGLAMRAQVGNAAPHYETVDSHGETFDMCEFAGDKPILTDLSAGWCGPCQGFANYISTGAGAGNYPPVKEAVDEGRILLIEYMIDDYTNNGAIDGDVPTFLSGWHTMYPNEKVIVAHGRNDLAAIYADGGGGLAIPSFALIGLDYKWESVGWDSLSVAASK